MAKVEQNERDDQRGAAPLAAMMIWCDQIMPCQIMRISAVGATCAAATLPPLGSHVTLRHSLLGSLNGMIVQHGLDGFTMAFQQEKAAAFALKAAMLALTASTTVIGQHVGAT